MNTEQIIADALYDHLVAEVGNHGASGYAATRIQAGPMMQEVVFTANLHWQIGRRRVEGMRHWQAALLNEYANETTFVARLATELHEWAQAERLAADSEPETHEASDEAERQGP